MAVGDYDLVGRAAEILRVAPEPGWRAIERDVLAAVRATPRGGWPLDVEDPDPAGARGVIRVSDLALTGVLSRALAGDPDYRVLDIGADSDDGVLQGVRVEVSCRYLADAHAVGLRIRQRCALVLLDVIGGSVPAPVAVTVGDIHR